MVRDGGMKAIAKATGGGDAKNPDLSPYMFVRSIYVGSVVELKQAAVDERGGPLLRGQPGLAG